MSPDLVKAIQNHHQQMSLWWKIPEYIRERKAFCKRNPICVRCGRPATTPGHSHEDYHSFDTYLAAVIQDKCDPLCSGCNLAEKRNLRPCPLCIKGATGKIWYTPQHLEYCFDHRPEEEKRQSEERKEVFKQLVKQSHSIQNARRRKFYQDFIKGGKK